MPAFKKLLLCLFLLTSVHTYAQQQDSVRTFKVFGECGQCKRRIESALKMKGVTSAQWSPDTKQLVLAYNSKLVSISAIEDKILAAGHDLENRKAKNETYEALPPCCHYREETEEADHAAADTAAAVKTAQLKEVTVGARARSSYVSGLNPIRTEVMTDKELLRAACCNLSESFETNPSVDVSYNDAVTGSKQIQLLGLSGNYTQLTVENLPGPRGLATPLGLNSHNLP